MALNAGDAAPDFELRSHKGGTVKLSDFRGRKHVVLAFHPLAFTPVCANQMCGYESDLKKFEEAGAAVLGVSIDAQPAKAAWAKTLGLSRPSIEQIHRIRSLVALDGTLLDSLPGPSAL